MRESNPQPSELESHALPLRQPPRRTYAETMLFCTTVLPDIFKGYKSFKSHTANKYQATYNRQPYNLQPTTYNLQPTIRYINNKQQTTNQQLEPYSGL